MRQTTAAVQAELQKETNKPIELYQMYLDEGTQYFAAHPVDVAFFSETGSAVVYEGMGINRTKIKTDLSSKVDSVTVTFDNVSQRFSMLMAHSNLIGRRLVIWKVFQGAMSNPADYVPIFDGLMDEPLITQQAMKIVVKSEIDFLGLTIPGRTYKKRCNSQFGDEQCQVYKWQVPGTVQGISVDGLTLTLSGRSESEDYYKDGILKIGNEYQMVTASNGASITVMYPFEKAKVGDSYTLRRGCDKTKETCVSRFANGLNYSGFLSIPSERRILG